MKKRLLIILMLLQIAAIDEINAQGDAFRPQLWNNFYLGWNLGEKISWRSAAAYNVLLSEEQPWNEITLSTAIVYKFKWYIEFSGGLYSARTKQNTTLNSYELRPNLGVRFGSKPGKRWFVTNISRIELRRFIYSDNDNNTAFRFRNRTYIAVGLNKPMIGETNSLVVFAYFEAFYNFGQEVRERFFNQFKYKLGLSYKIHKRWNIDAGVIYQDAVNNTSEPTTLPTEIITNYVMEWGIAYLIPYKPAD